MSAADDNALREKILEENRKVHAKENRFYLDRHPEQTNFYQSGILDATVRNLVRLLPAAGGRSVAGGEVLELGCGTGYMYLPLLARGCRMTGVDLSAELVRVLADRIPADAKPRAELVVADVMEFAARDARRFDAVVFSAVLHHLYDFRAALRACSAKLRTGGALLIFFEPLKQNIASPLRYALHKRLAALDEAGYKIAMKLRGIPLLDDDDYRHADYQRQFGGIDPEELADLLDADGFEILGVDKYCARRYGISALVANRLLRTQNTFNLLAVKL